MFTLIDDGTRDTTLICEECNEEQRYNFNSWGDDLDKDIPEEERMEAYDSFVDGVIAEANSMHECKGE